MEGRKFSHVELIKTDSGRARLTGGGGDPPAVERNKANRIAHSSDLKTKLKSYTKLATKSILKREAEKLPVISGGVPFVLQIPDENDGVLEFISKKLKLEVVAEYDDGFLIVATDDIDLQHIIDLADKFATSTHGSGQMARILDLDGDHTSMTRISRILDEDLISSWPFAAGETLTLDVSIEVAAFNPPPKPRGITSRTKPEKVAEKLTQHDAEMAAFATKWDKERDSREAEMFALVSHYGGEVLQITEDGTVDFSDSFSVRIKMSGEGFADLITNFPSLFEATIPELVNPPIGDSVPENDDGDDFVLLVPAIDSPAICVIDSGIQENHRWLEASIWEDWSKCFIPDRPDDEVADYVPAGGHGTRVAGACLYANEIPMDGEHQAPFWLINARVLDEDNRLQQSIFPPKLIEEIVAFYEDVKIFQHSIASNRACRTSRMSIWACAIDRWSHRRDALFIQAVGNLSDDGPNNDPGILQHIANNRSYPDYLLKRSSRIADPAQSLQALTVGSISQDVFEDDDRQSVSPQDSASAFTRSGFGMWDSIKPEVVEFGGDLVIDSGVPPALTTPEEVCPPTIRSTFHSGPAHGKDAVGTSFAAPKVAYIAGHLQSLYPDESSLLYRALIVNSARWPTWAESAPMAVRLRTFRTLGYGVPDLARSTENSEKRITLVTEGIYEASATDGYVFGVPIPEALRRPGDDFEVRIDVTLSYSAEPRRTRKARRGYLAVWLDWMASKKGESFDSFRSRALTDFSEEESGDSNFNWVIGNRSKNFGLTEGVNRKNGTVQKDWTIAQSYDLPEMFGVAVHAHKGWSDDDDEVARFTLVVSFEMLGSEINVYEEIKTAVDVEVQQRQELELII